MKRIWIAGGGKSAQAAALLLHSQGKEVFVTDSGALAHPEIFQDLGIPAESQGHSLSRLATEASCLVVSPGISLDTPLVQTALAHGIPVVSELDVASWYLTPTAKVCAVTGTNGKSTTTHFLGHLLSSRGSAVAGGNLGTPLSSLVQNHLTAEFWAVEVSSYQLETTSSLKPHVSLFLNLQKDHLERHKTLSAYLAAKWKLLLLTQPQGLAVVEVEVLSLAQRQGLPMPACKLVVLGKQDANSHYGSCWVQGAPEGTHFFYRAEGQTTHWSVSSQKLLGMHNALNMLAAGVAAREMGVDLSAIEKACDTEHSTYTPLAHRLEPLGTFHGVRWINDSKATNVASTLVALQSVSGPIRLLLGGRSKQESLEPLKPFLGENVVAVYPFGEAAHFFAQELKRFKGLRPESKTLLEAAEWAGKEAQVGDAVLLSPAGSSWDAFANFEERGETLRRWVQSRG